MTRLRTEWITYMLDGMEDYNQNLKAKSGMDLAELAAQTFGVLEKELASARAEKKIAVVPITQGEGIIGNFSESVAAIIQSMGFRADVMEHTDVNGIYDAACGGYDVLFFADDDRYLALNISENRASDNNYATALGFIQVLCAMMKRAGKDPRQEKILQIGCGIVGREAVSILKEMEIDVVLYDKNTAVLADFPGKILTDPAELKQYSYILDFTNEGEWLHKEDLCEDVLYASPGVPYSMDAEAAAFFEARAVHDNLEIGTAIMLGESLFGH